MMTLSFWGRWAADLVMVLVATIWAFNNVVMKVALASWDSAVAFNAVRFSLGAVILALFALLIEGSLRLPKGLLWKVALLGLIGNGVNQMLFVSGLALGNASNGGAWLGIVPVLVALISGLFGMEKITPRLWAGALVSTVGILTVLFGDGLGFAVSVGDLFFLGAVVTWAGYTVFSRPLANQASPLRVTAVAMLFAAAGLLILNGPALARQDLGAIPLQSWLGMGYAAVMSNAVGYALYVWSVRRAGAARASLYNNLGPVLTAAGAYLFLGERFAVLQWLGVLCVITGVLVARWDDIRQALRKEKPPGKAAT